MEHERDRFRHLLIILLEALASDPEVADPQSRIRDEAAAAGLSEDDVNGLLDWIEAQWDVAGPQPWAPAHAPAAPGEGTFRHFGPEDAAHLSGASLGYLLRLLTDGQINRAQLEELLQYASYLSGNPVEPEDLESILEQVLFRPGQPRMTGGASEGYWSIH